MTIPAGYVDQNTLPVIGSPPYTTLFGCIPKAGLWLNASVNEADATETAFDGTDPDGEGIASISFCVLDMDGDGVAAWGGASHDGLFTAAASFVEPGGGVIYHPVSAVSWHLSNKGVGALILNESVGPGWNMAQENLYPDAGTRAFFLALQGDNMESQSGTFTTPGDGTGNSIATTDLTGDPDLVIFFGVDQGSGGCGFTLGAVDATGNQWAVGMSATHITVFPSPPQQHQFKQGVCGICPTVVGFGSTISAEISAAIVSGGFQVTDVPHTAAVFGYLAIRDPDGEFSVGSGDMTDGTSGLGATPEAVLAATVWSTDQAAHDHGGISIGYAAAETWEDQPTAPLGVATFCESDAQGNDRWRTNSSAHTLVQSDSGGTLLDTLDVALTSDGFTTTASDGSMQYGWITMRGSTQSDCQAAAFTPHIYRLVLP